MSKKGFTIVELLIVIVVIAILAALTIVAYNGIQQRARDSVRKSDLAAIAKALKLYAVDNNGPMWSSSGCGANGNGSGFFNYEDGTNPGYPKSMNTCLKDGGYVSKDIIDPSGLKNCGGVTCHTYMKYTCAIGSNVVTYLYANLESLPAATNEADGTCYAAGDTERGMNYVVKVE